MTNHLGNVLVTVSDKKLAVSANGTTIDYYNADVVTANDYYPFGMQMPGRKFSQPNTNYRYGFNGKENDNSTGEGSLDFGARIMDVRLGRWLGVDKLEKKYPSFSPYIFAINSTLRVIDIDGNDIIILSAQKAVGGLGHAAVLIGDDTKGWKLYSKNGTFGSIRGLISFGPNNNNPENGVYFKTLQQFANSSSNFHHGEVQYEAAIRLVPSTKPDSDMELAASKQVNKWYDVTSVFSGSCIDVVVDALKAGNYHTGYVDLPGDDAGVNNKTPNIRFGQIASKNLYVNVTNQILPTNESKDKYKKEEETKLAKELAEKKAGEITVEKVKASVSPGGLQAAVNKIVQSLSTPR